MPRGAVDERQIDVQVFGRPPRAQSRVAREKSFYDKHGADGFRGLSWLSRLSVGFYEKGEEGRVWGPVWKVLDLRGAVVLDYGCGDGSFSHLLTHLGARVHGLDVSSELIAKARAASSSVNGYPLFLVADAHETPFPDSFFDYVVGNGVLHHLDLNRAYAEVARVLRPGGKAFFQEPMYHHPLVWLLRRVTQHLHTEDERPLCLSDIESARRWFCKVSRQEHFLLAVFAAPTHLLGKNSALMAIRTLDRLDQFIMRLLPSARQLAWLTLIELEK